MNFVAVVQARFSSKRLPKKIIMSLDEEKGKPVILEHLVERIQKANLFQTIIAIPEPEYDLFFKLSFLKSCRILPGPTYDVLDRFILAVSEFKSDDYLVRITADNPFIDYEVLNKNIGYAKEIKPEYSYPRWLPLGMGYEIIKVSTLRSLMGHDLTNAQKEHVTTFIKENKDSFNIKPFFLEEKEYIFSTPVRLTVDVIQDLKMVQTVFQYFQSLNRPFFTARDVFRLRGQSAGFFQKNQNVVQRSASISEV